MNFNFFTNDWVHKQKQQGFGGCHGSNQFNSYWPLQKHDQIYG